MDAILLSLRVASSQRWCGRPFGISLAWLLARRNFWGNRFLGRAGPSAAGAAAGRHRYLLLLTFENAAWSRLAADHLASCSRPLDRAALAARDVFPCWCADRLSIEAATAGWSKLPVRSAPNLQLFATVTLPLALPGVSPEWCSASQGDRRSSVRPSVRSNIPGEPRPFRRHLFADPDP